VNDAKLDGQFSELADDALEFSKTHKRSHRADKGRIAILKETFGGRAADSITPQDFDRWLSSRTKLKPATLNRYRALVSLTYRLGRTARLMPIPLGLFDSGKRTTEGFVSCQPEKRKPSDELCRKSFRPTCLSLNSR
jgi:hypothetical protein